MTGTYIVRRGRRFAVVVYMGKDPANRTRNRRKWYGGFATHREAQVFQATFAHHPAFSAGMGIYGNSRLRTCDYLDTWPAQHAKNGKIEEKTEERYRQFIQVHITPALGHVPLVRLSPQTIQEAYGTWLSKGLSHTTARHIANLLHLALDQAVRRGLIVRNPLDQTDPPSRDERPASILTLTHLTQYLDDAKGTGPVYLWALYVTKAMTGMRFGELLGLRDRISTWTPARPPLSNRSSDQARTRHSAS
jgi:hypothetical protein